MGMEYMGVSGRWSSACDVSYPLTVQACKWPQLCSMLVGICRCRFLFLTFEEITIHPKFSAKNPFSVQDTTFSKDHTMHVLAPLYSVR